MSYPPEAVQKCANLYARGHTHTRIEEEMQKEWPDWTRKNLYGENGWIEKHGFDDARERYQRRTKQLEIEAEQTTNEMLGELVAIRKQLYQDMQSNEQLSDPQKVYAYDKITRTLVQLLKADDATAAEGIDLDSNQLFQVLMKIPDVRDAIEKNRPQILKEIERV